jgi:hypothetical protein
MPAGLVPAVFSRVALVGAFYLALSQPGGAFDGLHAGHGRVNGALSGPLAGVLARPIWWVRAGGRIFL